MRTGKADYLPFINICVVVLALVVVGVLALVLPKPTVSEIEKRELAKNAAVDLVVLVFRSLCQRV